MPLSSSQPSKARRTSKRTTSSLRFELRRDDSPPPAKKPRLLTSFAKPPAFITPKGVVQCDPLTGPKTDTAKKHEDDTVGDDGNSANDQLWSDKYEPITEADLAVHKRKVEDVRKWLMEALYGGLLKNLKRYRRILTLTGPAGTGKTTTIRVLARELGVEILEWKNPIDDNFSRDDFSDDTIDSQRDSIEYESLSEKFQSFLLRASRCRNILTAESSSTAHIAENSSEPRSSKSNSRRQIILLEDLPNILHDRTREKFHSALESVVHSPHPKPVPIVIIVSDAGLRGKASDERRSQGFSGSWGKEVVDVRSVLPSSLLNSVWVTQISFNPIAPTLLRKALQHVLQTHFSSTSTRSHNLPKDALDIIVETSNGDIRSAIMALQFAFVMQPRDKKGKKAIRGGANMRRIFDAVTRREQSLALFHLLGKVLYNKRKGDPPSASAKAKDLERERVLDARLKDAPSHPPFLAEHDRRASRVDVETLYSDAPIESSLFSLYIHQNYTQFCDNMDQCDGVADWLSWIDSSGGELWHQANPHCFHLLTLGTLHSLPSPVTRRSQKICKPEFFRFREKELEARSGAEATGRWITRLEDSMPNDDAGPARWNIIDIVTEIGGVLKAREHFGTKSRPPASHRLFSQLMFARGDGESGQQLEEEDLGNDMPDGMLDLELAELESKGSGLGDVAHGGWLETDDIEDF